MHGSPFLRFPAYSKEPESWENSQLSTFGVTEPVRICQALYDGRLASHPFLLGPFATGAFCPEHHSRLVLRNRMAPYTEMVFKFLVVVSAFDGQMSTFSFSVEISPGAKWRASEMWLPGCNP